MPKPANVMLAIPHGDTLCPQMLAVVANLVVDSHQYDYGLDLCCQQGHLPSESKNRLAERFLESTHTHILYMDADNPPTRNPLELVKLDLDIIGCPTPVFSPNAMKFGNFPITWNVYERKGEFEYAPVPWGEGITEVDAIGGGCMLIKRRVIEAMPAPFVWKLRNHKKGTPGIGDDINFAERAIRHNFKLHCAWSHPCDHYKQVNLLQILQGASSLADALGRTHPETPS